MAGAIINIAVLGFTGLLSIPTLSSLFSPAQPDKIIIEIGVGATSSEFPDGNPGGNCPSAVVFDVNGNMLGFTESHASDNIIVDGGSHQLAIGGAEGSLASVTPAYIQLLASGSDAVCIAWLSTTSSISAGSDFRSWNGAYALVCGLPSYPSQAQFPGIRDSQFRPPCFWMSNDGRFVEGFNARLFDFFFPESVTPGHANANSTATQWTQFPDTLCKAPARQQFFNTTEPGCGLFYPSALSIVNQKDENGFDLNFDAVESSFTMRGCTSAVPFNNNVDLELSPPVPTIIPIQPNDGPPFTLPASVTSLLQSSLNLGHLRREVPATVSPNTPPDVTAVARLPERSTPKKERKEPVLNRRVEKREEQPHLWCEENRLVVSSYTGHSAVQVCESESSWGPDFASLAEGIFCDMCLRQAYPLCSGPSSEDSVTATGTASLDQATTTGSSPKGSPLLDSTETCFDLDEKQLRAPARLRRDKSIPIKRYDSIKHWK